jgi:hypothetical protein
VWEVTKEESGVVAYGIMSTSNIIKVLAGIVLSINEYRRI